MLTFYLSSPTRPMAAQPDTATRSAFQIAASDKRAGWDLADPQQLSWDWVAGGTWLGTPPDSRGQCKGKARGSGRRELCLDDLARWSADSGFLGLHTVTGSHRAKALSLPPKEPGKISTQAKAPRSVYVRSSTCVAVRLMRRAAAEKATGAGAFRPAPSQQPPPLVLWIKCLVLH
jgi:hypothetical protein